MPNFEQYDRKTHGGCAGQFDSAISVSAPSTWLCSTPVEALQCRRGGGLSSATTGRAAGSIAEESQVKP